MGGDPDNNHSNSQEPDRPDRVTQIVSTDGQLGSRRADTFRARLNAPITVSIEDLTGERVAIGTGILRDLSLQGAMITELRLPAGIKLDPEATYSIRFRLIAGPLTGLEADCKSVRYDAKTRGFGVRIPEGFRLPLV